MKDLLELLFGNMPANLLWIDTLKQATKEKSFESREAENCAEKLYSSQPEYVNAFSRLAYYLTSVGEYSEADRLFIKDAESGRQTWWGKLRHAECIALWQGTDKAFVMVDSVYKTFPEAVNGYGHIAWTLLRNEVISEINAVTIIQKDVELKRISKGFKLVASEISVNSNFEFAFKLVQELYDSEPDIKDGFARIGLKEYKAGKYANAVHYFAIDEQYGRISPAKRLVYACSLLNQGKKKEAAQQVEEAYKLSPDLKDGYAALGEIAKKKNDIDSSVALFQKDDHCGRLSVEMRLFYAQILMNFGDYEEGEYQLKKTYEQSYSEDINVPVRIANIPVNIELVRKEFRKYGKPNDDVLNILNFSQAEWKATEYYRRVHINEFYEIYTNLEKKPEYILEWGSGLSTIIISRLGILKGAEYFLSIDDNKNYQDTIRAAIAENSFTHLHTLRQTGQIWPWEADEDNYATFPLSTGVKFDFIFIDGRRRNECMLSASQCLADDGIILLHDSWRQRYDLGRSLFTEFKSLDYYTLLKKKSK